MVKKITNKNLKGLAKSIKSKGVLKSNQATIVIGKHEEQENMPIHFKQEFDEVKRSLFFR